MVEVLIPNVTHYKKLKERKVKSILFDPIIGQVTLLRNNIDSRINQV